MPANIFNIKTWSIAADLNHIVQPTSLPTETQKYGKEPELKDRIAGSILFALSLLFVIPGCLYLYWASKKVDQILVSEIDSPEAKVNKTSTVFLKNKKKFKAKKRIKQTI